MPAGTRRRATRRPAAAGAPLRIRMYRVGFGDFFLLTVPSAKGEQHVLVDCGVTRGKTGQGDIGTLKDAVADMATTTGGRLALVVVTHRHQDHLIGFSRCADVFRQLRVDAIWMSYWETEYVAEVRKLQADLAALALEVQGRLALEADGSAGHAEAMAMLENATGVALGVAGTGGGSNPASLELLKTGLGVKPAYLHRGQEAPLPAGLAAAGLTAELLGPPPREALDFLKLEDLRKGVGQYLDAAAAGSAGGAAALRPFGAAAVAGGPGEYPASAFREWKGPRGLVRAVKAAQPALLYLAAKKLDDFLNNQSLVVLFGFRGKRLLFAGDAQAGNWEYWMYDAARPTTTPGGPLGKRGGEVLGHLDFYKVGHHGSTNATPLAAVEAMGGGLAAMCSTQGGAFGSAANASEVPRVPLLQALARKSALVRSDQLPAQVAGRTVAPAPGAAAPLPTPRAGRFVAGRCWVDYLL